MWPGHCLTSVTSARKAILKFITLMCRLGVREVVLRGFVPLTYIRDGQQTLATPIAYRGNTMILRTHVANNFSVCEFSVPSPAQHCLSFQLLGSLLSIYPLLSSLPSVSLSGPLYSPLQNTITSSPTNQKSNSPTNDQWSWLIPCNQNYKITH